MTEIIQDSINTYKNRWHQIVWPIVFFVAFSYTIFEVLKLVMAWLSLGGGMLITPGYGVVGASLVSTVFAIFFLVMLLVSSFIFFVKHGLDVLDFRKISEKDFNIFTILKDGYSWILSLMVLYIPIVLISVMLLPNNIYIYNSPFQLSILEGAILLICQLLLLTWGSITAFVVSVDDDQKLFTKLIGASFKILSENFVNILTSVAVSALLMFPFYAIPAGFNLGPSITILGFLLVAGPIGFLIINKTILYAVNVNDLDYDDSQLDKILINDPEDNDPIDKVVEKVSTLFDNKNENEIENDKNEFKNE